MLLKKLGIFGLMAAAAGTTLLQPTVALAQDYYGRGTNYVYGRTEDRRDDWRGREFRQEMRREAVERERAHEWREREWREQERVREREYRFGVYAPPVYGYGYRY